MGMSKVAVVQLSQECVLSQCCVSELLAICKKFDSDHILPVIVRVLFLLYSVLYAFADLMQVDSPETVLETPSAAMTLHG